MNGGEIFVRKALSPTALDQWWEGLVMAAVGETLDPADAICGVRIVDRSAKGKPMYRAEVWFSCSDKSDPGLVDKIRENTAAVLQMSKFDYKDVRCCSSRRGRLCFEHSLCTRTDCARIAKHTSTISQGFAPTHHGQRR